MTTARRARSANVALLLAAILISLGVLEFTLRVFNLAPPRYDYGDPEVGWRSATPTGRPVVARCFNPASERTVEFERNEDGVRSAASSAALLSDSLLSIAVGGDSHTDLCESNDQVHFGYLERFLRDSGLPVAAYSYAAGKYSPLQAYLAVRPAMRAYQSEVFVLNLYTGNDFMDMLRIDDRPHLVPTAVGYRIAPPVWYQQDAPGTTRSIRLLSLWKAFGDAIGMTRIAVRVAYLRDAAADQGKGMRDVIGYINDLRRSASPSVGYSQAFTAQMLNQQLFFQRFDGSRDESLRRLGHLLALVRSEFPDRLLVLSPVPSFQLVHPEPIDSALNTVLARLRLSYAEGVAEELGLYEAARELADSAGWLFVDNLPALREARGSRQLYNTFDYHIEPVASEIIGRNEADSLRSRLRARAGARRAFPQ